MVEKIEQLTDSMNELQDNILDINETLNTDVIQFDNNELEHELNELTLTEPNIIAKFPVVPQDEFLSPAFYGYLIMMYYYSMQYKQYRTNAHWIH